MALTLQNYFKGIWAAIIKPIIPLSGPEANPSASQTAASSAGSTTHQLPDVVPVFDIHGRVTSYIPRNMSGIATAGWPAAAPTTALDSAAQRAPPAPYIPNVPQALNTPNNIALTPGMSATASAEAAAAISSTTASSGPPIPTPVPPPIGTHAPSPIPSPPTAAAANNNLTFEADAIEWDPWLDGAVSRSHSFGYFTNSQTFMVHWSMTTQGGEAHGNEAQLTWEQGKRTVRKCNGIIVCNECGVVIRPKTKVATIRMQAAQRCPQNDCGGYLRYESCSVSLKYYRYLYGVHIQTSGTHSHRRPTHILHLTKAQKAYLTRIFDEHPNDGPLMLQIGRPGQPSVSDEVDLLINTDRVRAKRTQHRRQRHEDFPIAYASFAEQHQDFIIGSEFGDITVVCMQSNFMRSQLVRSQTMDGTCPGIVSDATYKFWREPTCVLIISSFFNATLSRWVPALMTYANGTSATHYYYHFNALFQSIAMEFQQMGSQVTDEVLANVVDFSEAERNGFVMAYVSFRQWEYENGMAEELTATEDDLRATALNLLKGCQQHYRAQVTRVSAISAVVNPARRAEFQRRAHSLVDLTTVADFNAAANSLQSDFPFSRQWLDWWRRAPNARMIFESHRTMPEELWRSLPDTTNAAEAMHSKIYKGIGKEKTLIDGLYALYAFVESLQKTYTAARDGMKIGYGDRRPWDTMKGKIGRTKISRTPGYRRRRTLNDGRPMDTAAQLVGTRTKAPALEAQSAKSPDSRVPQALPGMKWRQNSCWLDTSLQLLHHAIARDAADFTRSFISLSTSAVLSAEHQPIYEFINVTMQRQEIVGTALHRLDLEERTACTEQLSVLRDSLRQELLSKNIIDAGDAGESNLWTWLMTLLSRSPSATRPHDYASVQQLYFAMGYFTWRTCTGNAQAQIPKHHQLTRQARLQYMISLPTSTSVPSMLHYDNHITAWFRDLLSLNQPDPAVGSCWRQRDGHMFCDGAACRKDIVTSIPTVLILLLEGWDDTICASDVQLSIPTELFPLTKTLGRECGLVYNIVGRAYFDPSAAHFWARFTPDGKHVYQYDGLTGGGSSYLQEAMHVKDDLAGDLYISASDAEHPRPVSLVYHLRGGVHAQQVFFKHRTKAIEDKFHGIRLSDAYGPAASAPAGGPRLSADATLLPFASMIAPLYTRLAEDERPWMEGTSSATTDLWIDYNSRSPTFSASPTKRKRNHAAFSTWEEDDAWNDRQGQASVPPSEGETGSGPGSHKPPVGRVSSRDRRPPKAAQAEESGQPKAKKQRTKAPSKSHARTRATATNRDAPPSKKRKASPTAVAEVLPSNKRKKARVLSPPPSALTATQKEGRGKRTGGERPHPSLAAHHGDGGVYEQLSRRRNSAAYEAEYYQRLDRKAQLPLEERLLLGQGCLVRDGEFWYPARILNRTDNLWTIKFWRFRHFCSSTTTGSRALVREVRLEDIYDELWQDHSHRRMIRLGKWTRICDIPDDDDILIGFNNFPYSQEVEDILGPHLQTLSLILAEGHLGRDARLLKIPCIQWLRDSKAKVAGVSASALKRLKDEGSIPFEGPLSPEDRAQISNWISRRVPGASEQSLEWFGKSLAAHAQTILIAARRQAEIIDLLGDDFPAGPGSAVKRVQAIWDIAWKLMREERWSALSKPNGIDVDRECLKIFERKILENSEEAGRAGNWQWGLDAGQHEHNWLPYAGLGEQTVWGSPRSEDTDRDNEECMIGLATDSWIISSEDCEKVTSSTHPGVGPRPRARLRRNPRRKAA
ncbi:hypothetical protein BD626DRAFT_564741 [Schizophyllum amplum]|uniref:GCM domain-containing protein n=1 Tax=Schizophyllum amplum TaxID=97359 RepID=A0A550CSS9_9AGAR|nr:hypothetical protein BD626DRAFT_564741 [Auriculariopsis ampla]